MMPARESLEKAKSTFEKGVKKFCLQNFVARGIMLCFYNKIVLIYDDFIKFF